MTTTNERIVAEITRNWSADGSDDHKPLISRMFEEVIQVNRGRGYKLESWRFQQVVTTVALRMSETIIAVFVKDE